MLKNTGQRAASAVRTASLVAVTGCTVFLLGCPQQQTVTKAAAPPPNAVAPNLPKTLGGDDASTARQAGDPRVAALIRDVDKAYKSGVQNYRNNRLEEARNNFNSAVDLMLSSGFDIKKDPALLDEFERTVDAVNSLELSALKQGNDFNAKPEQAPLDIANELTFKTSPELTASLKNSLSTASDLPLVINDEVAGYINAFADSSSFRAHMVASLRRASKYQALIKRVLKEEGVPQDLIYLAVAESGFQLQVINSSSGAGGMWQFMPFQGAYGLARNGYFDERFDPEKSSRAYARYIKSLYNQFGDWYLAMAGYDWGPGNIQKAVMRTGYADYWELYRRNAMPRETRNYVPQILAAIIMAKNPEKYGLNRYTPDPPITYDTVSVSYAASLLLIADVTGTTLANVVALNPALLRLSTPRDLTYDLHIPAGTAKEFNDRMAAIPEDKRAYWRFHEVLANETLDQVAQQFHVAAADILTANDLPTSSTVEEGDELVIPVAGSSGSRTLVYVPRRGDTLVTVADRFNVSTEEIRTWNHLRSTVLPYGHRIYVAEPVRLAPAGRSRRHAGAAVGGRRGRTRRGTSSGKASQRSASAVRRSGSAKVSGTGKLKSTKKRKH